MHILIVKRGALGDVVRTSYFASALKRRWGTDLRLSWLTAPPAMPLLKFNPHIDDIWTSFEQCASHQFNMVFSFDDELDALKGVARLDSACFTGALLDEAGKATYTEDANEWFDMGLLSRFGKTRADELKKKNRSGHVEIFSKIFGVDDVKPEFFGDQTLEAWAASWLSVPGLHIGINPFAGGRWPSKELRLGELRNVVRALLEIDAGKHGVIHLTLFGAGEDLTRNHALVAEFADPRLRAAETDDSVLRFAALIGRLDYLVTSDSLALHLAVAQGVPFMAFFSPTSAAEIDGFGVGRKLISHASDYCSYRKNADNSSITSTRVVAAFVEHAADLGLLEAHHAVI